MIFYMTYFVAFALTGNWSQRTRHYNLFTLTSMLNYMSVLELLPLYLFHSILMWYKYRKRYVHSEIYSLFVIYNVSRSIFFVYISKHHIIQGAKEL